MASIKILKEVIIVFFKLGFSSFGGPAAHIAMMEKEIVSKRKWLSQEHFIDLVGATNLIPGPNSTEMAIHCSLERAGYLGLIFGGLSFIIPSVLITGIFAWFYKNYHSIPALQGFFYGIKPAVILIIINAVFNFGKKVYKNTYLWILGIIILAAAITGINEIFLICLAGVSGLIKSLGNSPKIKAFAPFILMPTLPKIGAFSNAKLFWVFFKIGAVLFGSGYVLFAYLDDELVKHLAWISRQELMDAIAVGQFTPGPVLSASTFIGYQLNGWSGACIATAAIFIPSFFFVALLNPFVKKVRTSIVAASFIDAVNAAAIALMFAVAIQMGRLTIITWQSAAIGILAAITIFYFKKLSSFWIILGSSLLGYLLNFL